GALAVAGAAYGRRQVLDAVQAPVVRPGGGWDLRPGRGLLGGALPYGLRVVEGELPACGRGRPRGRLRHRGRRAAGRGAAVQGGLSGRFEAGDGAAGRLALPGDVPGADLLPVPQPLEPVLLDVLPQRGLGGADLGV